jgi:AcrR family transcriptional regulator
MEANGKRTRQSTEVRQAHLLEAALALAAQRSPADITTADLARAVGISQGAVFRHFPSKEAIWLAALDWATQGLMRKLQAAAEGADHPLAAVQAVFLTHVDFVIAHPGVPRLVFQELQQPQDTPLKTCVRQLMQQYRQLLTGLLQRAREQGQLGPAVDLQAAAVLFIGSMQGLVMQSMLSGQVQAMAGLAPGVLQLYLRAISVTPPSPIEGTP